MVYELVDTSGFISFDDLEVRGHVLSNYNTSLTTIPSSVVRRLSHCATARCLQAAKVVETKCEQLERMRAIAAAAAAAERPIFSHDRGR